jgi:prepilin-type N-terminal cleavage/methylation domain-containing protein
VRTSQDAGRRQRRTIPEFEEHGFTLLELVVAVSLLAVVAVGFTMSIGVGFKSIAVARQRQTASEVVNARLEHLRSLPYGQVALSTAIAHEPDAGNPDSFVSADGSAYDVTGDGDLEPLVVEASGGLVLHFEDPVQVSTTVMRVFQYVTWVDDPAVTGTEDYKRVTVVAQFRSPAASGVSQFVRASSLFTTGTVTVTDGSSPTTTTVPSAATTTTTAPSSTTTVPPATCPGDTTAPSGSFSVAGTSAAEAGYTAALNITLTLSFADTCTPIVAKFTNDGSTYGGDVTYDPINRTVSWSLTSGDGTKTVSGRVRDGAGNDRVLNDQNIVVDTTKPTVPGSLTRTIACAGTNRTVTLHWGFATDTNLRGYRVYKSTDGATWHAFATASTLALSDTHKKSLDTVRYYVVAYDKAGNESNATNIVSLAKNQCA